MNRTLTAAERARRLAALGITQPPPQARPSANGHSQAARPLAGTLTLKKAAPPPAPPPPAPPPPAPPPPAPAAPPPTDAEQAKANAFQRFKTVKNLLESRWPLIFSWGRPLAVGIDKSLRSALTEEELPTADLEFFLKWWVHRKPYRDALQRGDRRVHLDGSDAGPAWGQAALTAGQNDPQTRAEEDPDG